MAALRPGQLHLAKDHDVTVPTDPSAIGKSCAMRFEHPTMAERVKKKFIVKRDGKPNLYFEGAQLGSGRDEAHQVTLYRAASGKFIVSIEANQRDPFGLPSSSERDAIVASSVESLILALNRKLGPYNDGVKAAFFEASDVEPALRKYSVEEI